MDDIEEWLKQQYISAIAQYEENVTDPDEEDIYELVRQLQIQAFNKGATARETSPPTFSK